MIFPLSLKLRQLFRLQIPRELVLAFVQLRAVMTDAEKDEAVFCSLASLLAKPLQILR